MNNSLKNQIIAGYQTHEQLKKLIPIYDTDESPVSVQNIHAGIEVGSCGFNISGLQMFIGADCSYDDYIKLLNYATQNPIKKEIFDKARKLLESEATDDK